MKPYAKPLSALLTALLIGASAVPTVTALEPHGTGILCRNWLTNDPDYTFSASYKTSVWYENFTALELGENERNNILSIAISQLGYHEGDDGDYSGTNTSSGGNCVEYFRLLIPTWSDNSDEWCACFVNWCLNQARIDYASSEIGCWKWVEELKAMNMFQDSAAYKGTYTPKPADMIFFNWNGTNTSSGHIGYVLYTTDTHVYTIEGNADNNVTVRSYALDDPCIIGYGTPPYEEGNVPTVDHSYKNGMPRGEYVVNGSGLYLYKDAGNQRIGRVALGSRVLLIEEEGAYAKIKQGDQIGYVQKDHLYLMAETKDDVTLTFDTNGGTGSPADVTVLYGDSVTLGQDTPTMEGDTFLGWSLVPHNYRVDYRIGDTLTLNGNTTLYAVWEKRSLSLAKEALAAGKVAEFERPDTITNSSALLLGTLTDLSFFDMSAGSTKVSFTEDKELGRVLSFMSTEHTDDPFVTLNYGTLCNTLRLAPVKAEEVAYIVLRVKDVSLHNLSLELSYDCGAGLTGSVTKLLKMTDKWQYVVLDMSHAEGWKGALRSLRIDWQQNANEAGNTMLISDLFFVGNEALMDAVTVGQYVYPAQELLPDPNTESEPLTETDATSADQPVDGPGDSGESGATGSGSNGDASSTEPPTAPTEKPGGCASSLGAFALSVPVLMTLSAAGAARYIRRRKDENE